MLDAPAGASMIDRAHALPYDYSVVDDGLVPDKRAAQAGVPTMILAADRASGTVKAMVDLMRRPAHLGCPRGAVTSTSWSRESSAARAART